MSYPIKSPRKLIEVALPLDAISEGCQQEKNPFLKGHPRSIHLWWARRPLAAARAVIFAQLVNDPGFQQGGGFKYGKNKKEAAIERKRLFNIIKDLVQWKNINNKELFERARAEICRSWREVCELNKDHPQAAELFNPEKLPAFHDPFAGGGAIPLEAQRLGLESYASDLNPVAVLINKAMIEIPSTFTGRPPVGPEREGAGKGKRSGKKLALTQTWPDATGLAEDVRRYGAWMRTEAEKRIGHLFPSVEITKEMCHNRPNLEPLVGQHLNVIAWLWTRTIQCPNPGCSARTPMVRSFWLSEKPGKKCFAKPILDHATKTVRFEIITDGEPPKHTTDRTGARCLFCETSIEKQLLRDISTEYGIPEIPLAIVAEGPHGRVYLNGNASSLPIIDKPQVPFLVQPMTNDRRWFSPPLYGLPNFYDLFTKRQLVSLKTFSDLAIEVAEKIRHDALAAGFTDDNQSLEEGGTGATAYANAISVYLATAISQLSRYSCTICPWNKANENVAHAFGRQAIPMTWDFAEAHPIIGSLSIEVTVDWVASAIGKTPFVALGHSFQADAQTQTISKQKLISTDPPYYDNIGYADLSDFFYVCLRSSLQPFFPKLFSTILVPKAEELVATPHRHGSKQKAEQFFLNGMTSAMRRLQELSHPMGPVTIYYAFRQSETNDGATSSTGWETFLESVLNSGFQLTGTWPMRTEKTEGLKGEVNALASSIVLVCRKRPEDAPTISRREFLRELNTVLPDALDEMTKGSGDERSPVAPVDLSQAIIGPGMAVFSKYADVLEADGSPMSVRTALQLINRFLAEDDFDADTQFCLHWFEQYGWKESVFGEADVLARSKSTSVEGLNEAGVLQSGSGKVRLLRWSEYPTDWDPQTDKRTPVWEALHHLIRALKQGGESDSGALLAALGGKAEAVRQLAYRLYTLCERLGQAEDARAYNELITSWTGIESAASRVPKPVDPQGKLFED